MLKLQKVLKELKTNQLNLVVDSDLVAGADRMSMRSSGSNASYASARMTGSTGMTGST